MARPDHRPAPGLRRILLYSSGAGATPSTLGRLLAPLGTHAQRTAGPKRHRPRTAGPKRRRPHTHLPSARSPPRPRRVHASASASSAGARAGHGGFPLRGGAGPCRLRRPGPRRDGDRQREAFSGELGGSRNASVRRERAVKPCVSPVLPVRERAARGSGPLGRVCPATLAAYSGFQRPLTQPFTFEKRKPNNRTYVVVEGYGYRWRGDDTGVAQRFSGCGGTSRGTSDGERSCWGLRGAVGRATATERSGNQTRATSEPQLLL